MANKRVDPLSVNGHESQIEAVVSELAIYLDSKIVELGEPDGSVLPNPRKQGFQLFVSLILAHVRIFFFFRAKRKVLREYVDSCLTILCDGSPSRLPTLKYDDYMSVCKFLGNFPLSYLLAPRDLAGKRMETSFASGKGLRYWANCRSGYKRWAKARLLDATPGNISLWYSILKGKSCGDVVTSSFAFGELVKHQKGLISPNNLSQDLLNNFMSTLEPVLAKIAKKLPKYMEKTESSTPQEKACFERPIAQGGSLREAFEFFFDPTEADTELVHATVNFHCPCCDDLLFSVDPSKEDISTGPISCLNCNVESRAFPQGETPTMNVQDGNSREDYIAEVYHVPGVGTLSNDKGRFCCIQPAPLLTTRPVLYDLRLGHFEQDGRVHYAVEGSLSHSEDSLKVRESLDSYAQSIWYRSRDYEPFGVADIGQPGSVLPELIRNATILPAKVVPVYEPQKIRVITKDPMASKLIASQYQQALIKILRKMDPFRSMGRRLDATDLFDLKEFRLHSDDPLGWASSDFSKASDGSAQLLNELLQDRILANVPEPMKSAIHASNRMHEVIYPWMDQLLWARHDDQITQELYEYLARAPCVGSIFTYAARHGVAYINLPDYRFGVDEPVHQKRGTLMGSVTSFPLLCLYVLGIHLINLNECGDKRPITSQLKGVLINGDDRLTVSSYEVEKHFDVVCQKYGMNLSPGKSYWNSKFANMNSQSYHYPLGVGLDKLFGMNTPTPRYVPYLNMGLYLDKRKTDSKLNDSDGSDPIVENQPRLISTIPAILSSCLTDKLACVVLSSFLHTNKVRLQKEGRGRNLFVSISLGGWGVVPPNSWVTKCTMAQRKLASKIFHTTPNGWLMGAGPLPGPTPDATPVAIKDLWHNWHKDSQTFNIEVRKFDLKDTRLIGKKKMNLSLKVCNVPRPYASTKGTPYKSCIERVCSRPEHGVAASSACGTISALNQLIDGPLDGHIAQLLPVLNKQQIRDPSPDEVIEKPRELTKLEGFVLSKFGYNIRGYNVEAENEFDQPARSLIPVARTLIIGRANVKAQSPLALLCERVVIKNCTGEQIAHALNVDRKGLADIKWVQGQGYSR